MPERFKVSVGFGRWMNVFGAAVAAFKLKAHVAQLEQCREFAMHGGRGSDVLQLHDIGHRQWLSVSVTQADNFEKFLCGQVNLCFNLVTTQYFFEGRKRINVDFINTSWLNFVDIVFILISVVIFLCVADRLTLTPLSYRSTASSPI